MKGVVKRQEREHRELAWAVWHIAALPTAKKFPPLADFLGEKKKPRRQTPEEMIAVAQMWHAAVTRVQ